jgi:hypothetical protein
MIATVRTASGEKKGHHPAPPDTKEPLQVRIPTAVKRRFKAHAAMRGMEPNELFVEVWEHYARSRTDTTAEES